LKLVDQMFELSVWFVVTLCWLLKSRLKVYGGGVRNVGTFHLHASVAWSQIYSVFIKWDAKATQCKLAEVVNSHQVMIN